MPTNITISNAAYDELRATLAFAFRHVPPQERDPRIEATLAMLHTSPTAPKGVFQAKMGGKRVGALFSFRRPDGAVLLWAPAMEDGCSSMPLLEALGRFCGQCEARAAVMLADRNQPVNRSELHAAGFEYLSDMLYMVGDTAQPVAPTITSPTTLVFLPLGESKQDFELMVEIVGQTYHNTRDFPKLLSLLPARGVLEGYRSIPTFRPELWFFIRNEGRDVGAILLTDQSEEQMELTYMGLAETAREKGFGREIVRFAKRIAQQHGRRHLLTTVDERNPAALKSYLAAGLRVWDRKNVFMQLFQGQNEPSKSKETGM